MSPEPKPLHVDRGSLQYSSVGVVDRKTGALGVVTQSYSPTGGRMPISGGVLYGRTMLRGRGEFSLFGQIEADTDSSTKAKAYIAGGQVRLGF